MNERHLACDRCRILKEKCIFPDEIPLACTRCARLAKRCVTSKRRMPAGRPRKPDATPTTPQAGAEFVFYSFQADDPATSLQTASPCADSQLQRVPAGKPTSADPVQLLPMIMSPSDPLLSKLQPRERSLLRIVFDKRGFICHFILGPSFADSILSQLSASLYSSPDVLVNVFLATSGMFANKMELLKHSTELDYANSARAVRALRRTGAGIPTSMEDVFFAVTLALGIVTFDLLVSGLNAHSVSRFAISLVEQFYLSQQLRRDVSRGAAGRDLEFALRPLIFLDTCNCIVRRKMPVSKYPKPESPDIDRYFGICGPLLPQFYDICSISHTLGAKKRRNRLSKPGANLDVLERSIGSWNACVPESPNVALIAEEITIVETQAKLYQQAALLIIHRLRFAFGERDETAREMSDAIFANIDKMYRISFSTTEEVVGRLKDEATPAFDYRLGLPFLVGAIEVEGEQERRRVLDELETVVYAKMYPSVCGMMRKFLLFVWEGRDSGAHAGAHWFDLVSRGPPLVLF